MFDEKLKEQFLNIDKFSNHYNNQFISLLWKDVHPYEYMVYWEKFNAISLLKKEGFKSLLNMEDITDKNRPHVKGVYKDFEIK